MLLTIISVLSTCHPFLYSPSLQNIRWMPFKNRVNAFRIFCCETLRLSQIMEIYFEVTWVTRRETGFHNNKNIWALPKQCGPCWSPNLQSLHWKEGPVRIQVCFGVQGFTSSSYSSFLSYSTGFPLISLLLPNYRHFTLHCVFFFFMLTHTFYFLDHSSISHVIFWLFLGSHHESRCAKLLSGSVCSEVSILVQTSTNDAQDRWGREQVQVQAKNPYVCCLSRDNA
jgi:hypothetical protein